MTTPLPPSQNIGPYYKAMGMIALLSLVAIVALAMIKGFGIAVIISLAVVFLLLIILFVRPEKFDEAFKGFIARLPFTKYDGPPAGGASS